jgi:hypothetical protein
MLQVTRSVPIVFAAATDPVGGLAHPGGNVTVMCFYLGNRGAFFAVPQPRHTFYLQMACILLVYIWARSKLRLTRCRENY